MLNIVDKSNPTLMKKRISLFLLFFLTVSFSVVFQGLAQQKVELPELKQKQKGIYARISTGIATGKTNYRDAYDIKGIPVPLIFQLGYQTGSSVAIYFNYDVMFIVNPETSGNSAADLMTVPQVGGGLSFYFGKGKNYIFADGNMASTRLLIDEEVYATNPGFGLNVGWGYDHNLVRHMSIGGTIFYHYSSMKDKDDLESPLTNNYLGVCLSFRFGK